MAYTVLARKYRPQTFADLVGQEHVTRTLGNAIRSGRVAHAFLFTGVRGVGKTTTARILAKALNCERGPTPEPCGECDICRDITAGRDTDVLEMDGASNNSVEDVRRLQESIPYRPSRDRFKIVIVDEVHMLSTGAFNAFLKTLEEPPPHVKFIFATTESHKVPVTIRSRCQRYDFRLIPQSVVTQRVREILRAESVGADDAAVSIVAREAAGSMRDALTLLDQIVAFGGEQLAGDEVARVLGIAEREVVHSIAAAMLSGDGAAILREVDRLASNGLDMLHFARQLLDLVRDMVVLVVAGEGSDLVPLVDEERQRALEVARSVDVQELQRAFSALSKIVDDVAQSGTPRTTLEMGLVRIATRPPLLPLAELVARLDAIERRGGGGGGGGGARRGGGARGTGAGTGTATGAGTATGTRADTGGTMAGAGAGTATEAKASPAAPGADVIRLASPHRPPVTLPSSAREAPPAPRGGDGDPPGPHANGAAADARASSPLPPASTAASPSPSTSPAASHSRSPSRPVSPSTSRSPSPSPATSRSPSPSPATSRSPSPSPATSRSPSPSPSRSEPPQANGAAALSAPSASAPDHDTWEAIVGRVMSTNAPLGAVLQHGAATVVTPTSIVLAFPPGSFFGKRAESMDAARVIAEAAEPVLGARPVVDITYSAAAEAAPTLADVEKERRDARLEALRQSALHHPVVVAATQVFALPRERMIVQIESE